jgi:hypothetical protein
LAHFLDDVGTVNPWGSLLAKNCSALEHPHLYKWLRRWSSGEEFDRICGALGKLMGWRIDAHVFNLGGAAQ